MPKRKKKKFLKEVQRKGLICKFIHLIKWRAFCWTKVKINNFGFFSVWAEMGETGLWAEDQTKWEPGWPLSGSPNAVCSYPKGYERFSETSWTNEILFLPWENLFILYLFLDLIKVGELHSSSLAWVLPHSANINRKGPLLSRRVEAGYSHGALISWLPWQSKRQRHNLQLMFIE